MTAVYFVQATAGRPTIRRATGKHRKILLSGVYKQHKVLLTCRFSGKSMIHSKKTSKGGVWPQHNSFAALRQ